ncbi:unnamed protein product, partial [Meganyctiphanes norvegica]
MRTWDLYCIGLLLSGAPIVIAVLDLGEDNVTLHHMSEQQQQHQQNYEEDDNIEGIRRVTQYQDYGETTDHAPSQPVPSSNQTFLSTGETTDHAPSQPVPSSNQTFLSTG